MLLPHDLHVHILVVVAVHGRHGAFVPQPEVDGVGALFEGYAGPGDVGWDVVEEGVVFGAEVVVFCFGLKGWLEGEMKWICRLESGMVGRRTSLSVLDIPYLRQRGNGRRTVLLYVLQEIDEILFSLVWFDE